MKVRSYVLCAGKGERMAPLSTYRPKCLWEVGGVPCARLIARKLMALGDVGVVHQYKDKELFDHEFRDLRDSIFLYWLDEPRGTAGDLLRAFNHLNIGQPPEPFVVHYGDCLVNVDIVDFFNYHVRNNFVATLLLTTKARSEYGRATVATVHGSLCPPYGKVTAFEEKPLLPPTWTGVGVFSPAITGYISRNGITDLARDVLPHLANEGLLAAYLIDEEYHDIGTPASYARVNQLMKEGRLLYRA